ncbi:hypothetical protein KUTeg_019028 [Tegillarca granosa]|uniref:PX domain-containing protein n=1 Tax=Tegillarca granosa TaxID=220873 RepID=A0ABQ9EBC7_TEGGR|nr:hypothetical protein KUTeg_019028 [Tegillarca granosa]
MSAMEEVDKNDNNSNLPSVVEECPTETVTDADNVKSTKSDNTSVTGFKGSTSSLQDGNSNASNISQDGTSDEIQSDIELISEFSSQPSTSTPLRNDVNNGIRKSSVRFEEISIESSHTSVEGINEEPSEIILPEDVKVPIIGYEVMEERSKFTLKRKFPGFRLALPPKRWFKDNFDRNFIEDRILGLQAFANNVTTHKDICNSKPVREFFCFDDPPGPHDSLEESRALCEGLEDTVYQLRRDLSDKEREIDLLNDELNLYKNQVEMLSKALREANISTKVPESSSSTSLAECDILNCPEVDQKQIEVDKDKQNNKQDEKLKNCAMKSTSNKDLPVPVASL